MIPEFIHKIGEDLRLTHDTATQAVVVNMDDGTYFDPVDGEFKASRTEIALSALYFTGVNSVKIITLPRDRYSLLVSYEDSSDVNLSYEIRRFGQSVITKPNTCTIYGTILDVSAKPVSGIPVKAFLNKAGYFTYHSGVIGQAAEVISDDAGYFELPLISGLNVTLSISDIGFIQRGYVPNSTSTELTATTLLKSAP